jgi:hypothetical protein
MDISKLEDVFKDIWEHDNKNKKPTRPYENTFQKWTFWLMIWCFLAGLVVALSTKVINTDWQKITALLLVIASQVVALVYQLSLALQSFKFIKEPTRHFLQPLTAVAAQDYQLAKGMVRFDRNQLEYVLARLKLEIAQMKSRVGMLVGAVETVGLVPVAVTSAFSAFGYFADGKIMFQEIDWIVYALMGLYVVVVPVLFFTHKLDRFALVVETAIKFKDTEANNAFNPDAPKRRAG